MTQLPSGTYDVKQALAGRRGVGLWRLMTGYRASYLWAAVCLGAAAIMKSGTYLLLRYFIDNVLGQTEAGLPLITVALGFVGLAVFEGLFTFLSGRLAAQTAEGIALRLRNYLYDHIQRLTFTYHDQIQTGELISRSTSDVDAVRRFFADQAIGLGRISLLFLVNLAALFYLDSRLAVMSIVVIPLVLVISLLFFRRISDIYEAYQVQEATLSTTLQENLTGVRVVKAFARQAYEKDKFEGENWEKYQRGRKLVRLHAFFWPTTDILLVAQLLTGYTLGALMAISGTISVGTYLAYAGLLVWLIFPMRNMGRLIVQMSTGLVSFGRVMEIVREAREDLASGEFQPTQPVRGELAYQAVQFTYGGEGPVLHDISFECAPGQVVALLGSTGSGKTSLVNLIPRFYDYTGGHIRLDGRELTDYPRAYLREQVGLVEQEPFLFSRTIRENITYGVRRVVEQADIEAAAKAAAIHEVILTFPEGYDTLVGEKGVTLSGGQKQRVAIARTLLKDPRILILDDSTSSVDTETEAEIREALARLMQGRTSFVIAHRIQSVMDADLILVMDQGRIVQRGRHAELMNQDGPYRRVYDMQAQVEVEIERELASV
jgi:ATP-binding cassette, subfamily B, bacterial